MHGAITAKYNISNFKSTIIDIKSIQFNYIHKFYDPDCIIFLLDNYWMPQGKNQKSICTMHDAPLSHRRGITHD